MKLRCSDFRRGSIAIVAIATLALPLVQDVLLGQAPAASAVDPTVDGGWPRSYVTGTKAQLVIYQPQVANWDGQKQMLAYAAVSYLPVGETKPSLGTVRLEAGTSVSFDERLVKFTNIKVAETNFPSLKREQVQDLLQGIEGDIPDGERVIALDRVLANIDQSQIFPKNVEGVKADAPVIFYSSRPAILVNFDGDPIWSPIRENDLKFAVNTNWDVFLYDATKTYYLRNERNWMKASDLKGPWTASGALPASFSKLPADDNWKDVKAALPGVVDSKSLPTVFISTAPAELIVTTGTPSYESVPNTKLAWVRNTDSDVFRMSTGSLYYLISGRWFSAPSFTGPWTFATLNLPEDFKKISLEHPRSRVLASVPGTSEAAQAVLIAQVPQTARVNKKELKAPDVVYQGQPQFQPVEQTTVSRAVNTDKDIIKVGDLYYMCFQGVWFMSRAATGPWEVASTVPKEIYTIPTSSPAHNVTYVTVVEDDSDDEWVTYAAVAGYTGMMVAWGCVVWGSGWYYPPYVGYGGFYPVYYPFYPSYGYGAWYNPWTGGYGRGAAWYGPYGGAGVSARYNPVTGTYSRGAAAWGPYGSRAAGTAYNPRTGAYGATRQGSGVYGSWGSTAVRRGDDWAQTSRVTNRATGATTRVTQGSGGGSAVTRNGVANNSGVVKTGNGDVYAGRDGNVYRRGDDGGWQKYDNGNWGSADRPTPRTNDGTTTQRGGNNTGTTRSGGGTVSTLGGSGTTAGSGGGAAGAGAGAAARPANPDTIGQLNRDGAARTEGATRTHDYGTTRSSGGSSGGSSSGARAGSYRPSGGARAGGGRRR